MNEGESAHKSQKNCEKKKWGNGKMGGGGVKVRFNKVLSGEGKASETRGK